MDSTVIEIMSVGPAGLWSALAMAASRVWVPGVRSDSETLVPYTIVYLAPHAVTSMHRWTWCSPVLGSPSGTLESNVTVNGSDTVAPSAGEAICNESPEPPEPGPCAPALAPAHAAATSPRTAVAARTAVQRMFPISFLLPSPFCGR